MDFLPNILNKVSLSGGALANLIFFLVAALVVAVSLVLLFHWRKYGMNGKSLILAELVYLAVSGALLFVAFLAIN